MAECTSSMYNIVQYGRSVLVHAGEISDAIII